MTRKEGADWLVLKPIAIKQTDDRILDALAAAIERQGLKAGDKLPPERIIGEMLGTSRNTVREALKRWEAMGLVEMRRGSGTYLRTGIASGSLHIGLTVAAPETVQSLLDVLEVRRGLEGEAAALCALRATDEELARLARQLELLTATHMKYGAAPKEDLEFHRQIIAAARSPLLAQIVETMKEAYTRLWTNPLGLRDFADDSLPFHATVLDAIRRRDPAGARTEMIALIDTVYDEISAQLPPASAR